MNKTIKTTIIIFCLTIFLIPAITNAKTCEEKYPDDGTCTTETKCAENTSEDSEAELCPEKQKCCHERAQLTKLTLQVPILGYQEASNIAEYIGVIYEASLYIIIPFIIIMIIFSGLLWVFAAGDKSIIQKAKARLMHSFIGLGIVLFSYVILSVVGINQISDLTVEYIEPMPIPVILGEFEGSDTFNMGTSSGAPPVAGTMPRLFQSDYCTTCFNCGCGQGPPNKRCGHKKNVHSSGCGTVSAAMILRYYGKNIDVPGAVKFMGSVGAIGCKVVGTSPTGFKKIAEANGLRYQRVSVNFETMKNYVAGGKPIIANVGNPGGRKATRTCTYTGGGHYIVLSGWDAPNNRFIINDPGGKAQKRYNGTWHDLTSRCVFKGAYYIGN
jgi:peptidase C39-like protein